MDINDQLHWLYVCCCLENHRGFKKYPGAGYAELTSQGVEPLVMKLKPYHDPKDSLDSETEEFNNNTVAVNDSSKA